MNNRDHARPRTPAHARSRPLTPAEAYPHAMSLLVDLGTVVGDKAGIQAAIDRVLDDHPQDWGLVLAAALGWTFAEHTRLDPAHRPAQGATA